MGVKRTQIVKFIRKGQTGDKGDRGPAMRGPQLWKDCATGYAFQAGAPGEDWKDVVIYNDQYYSCVKSHAKTSANYPGSSVAVSNGLWQLGDKVEMVAARILLAAYALVENLGVESVEMKDADGNVLFEARGGNVTCKTGTFDNVAIQSGRIGGFSIVGTGLTNTPFDNDATVLFKNEARSSVAAIGGSVIPAASGARAVALFQNHDTTDTWGLGVNYGMLLSARGVTDCRALQMDGGSVVGFAMRNTIIGEGKTSASLTRYDYNVLALNTGGCTLTLPGMQLYDDGHVIRVKRLGSGKLYLKLSYCWTYGEALSEQYSRPVLVYDDGKVLTGTNTLELTSVCDAMELVWVRDLTYTVNGTAYYGAWVQYKIPRDW